MTKNKRMIGMYYYIILPNYNPWNKHIVPFIAPPPVPPAAVIYRNVFFGYW
jgi:hypothetical protein